MNKVLIRRNAHARSNGAADLERPRRLQSAARKGRRSGAGDLVAAAAVCGLRFRALLVIACAAVWATAGCSSRRPLEAWRTDVSRFVVMEGNGDPTCLRDTSDLRTRRIARVLPLAISSIEPGERRSRDVGGVLVGQCQVGGRSWYVFVVAVIQHHGRRNSEIETVRPVAFTADARGLHWFTPRAQDKPHDKYLDAAERQKRAFATRYAMFPGPQDVFEMEASGQRVTIHEKTSGAQWTVQLPSSVGDPADQNRRPAETLAAAP